MPPDDRPARNEPLPDNPVLSGRAGVRWSVSLLASEGPSMNRLFLLFALALTGAVAAFPPAKPPANKAALTFPPTLPDGKTSATDTSDDFLKPAATLQKDVAIAKTAPTVDFLYYPGQTYPGKPWSTWGDSLAAGGKYYASLGDHLAPEGNAFVYEYDPRSKAFRQLLDLRKLLNLPAGHYTPGKIHGRLDLGDDGWLYCSTHRGSTTVTTDKYHYQGDWIVRVHPQTGKQEIVVQGPVPKACIPNSVLDPKRLIFYGGTASSDAKAKDVHFFAYDVANRKLLYSCPHGPPRYLMLARSTGRVYYVPDSVGESHVLMRYDPKDNGPPVKIATTIGVRAATAETPQGMIYTVSQGKAGDKGTTLYAFDTRTEQAKEIGPAPVGKAAYVASIDADPTGRYLYYIGGAHGGSDVDGSPVVQFDTKTGRKKVLAFLQQFYEKKYGAILRGTYSTAVDPQGDKLYVTWNVSRLPGAKAWDCVALTVIHIPESERRP
jgi:hypothetical protein